VASRSVLTFVQTAMLRMMRRKFVLGVAFLLLASTIHGVTITTAPVVVEEEGADRGDNVAKAASGVYEQVVQVNKLEQRCPSNISVVLNHESNEEYNVQLPTGLVDLNSDCTPLGDFTAQAMVMNNFGRAISTLAVVFAKSSILEHSTHLTGSLPEGALTCPTQSGEVKTFGKLSITSLKEPISLLLRMALERIGVPGKTLDSVFKKGEKLNEWISDRQALTGDAWRVQAAMKPLETAFALLLGPKSPEGSDRNLLGLFQDACFYVGGQRGLKSVMGKIKNLVDALLPIARRARFARFGLPVPDFFSFRKPCQLDPTTAGSAAINQIRLEKIPVLNKSEADIGEMFAVTLNGGTVACGSVNVSRFIQIEEEYNSSTRTSANYQPSGQYVVKLVDEMIAMFDRYGAGSSLFKKLLADEQVAGFFPGVLEMLAMFEFKTNILVGRVDLSNCTAGEAVGNVNGNNNTATVVLINRPSIMIECADGVTNSTCMAKKNVILNTPDTNGSNNNSINDTANVETQSSVRQIFDESSLILVPEYTADSCVFSTLRPVA